MQRHQQSRPYTILETTETKPKQQHPTSMPTSIETTISPNCCLHFIWFGIVALFPLLVSFSLNSHGIIEIERLHERVHV